MQQEKESIPIATDTASNRITLCIHKLLAKEAISRVRMEAGVDVADMTDILAEEFLDIVRAKDGKSYRKYPVCFTAINSGEKIVEAVNKAILLRKLKIRIKKLREQIKVEDAEIFLELLYALKTYPTYEKFVATARNSIDQADQIIAKSVTFEDLKGIRYDLQKTNLFIQLETEIKALQNKLDIKNKQSGHLVSEYSREPFEAAIREFKTLYQFLHQRQDKFPSLIFLRTARHFLRQAQLLYARGNVPELITHISREVADFTNCADELIKGSLSGDELQKRLERQLYRARQLSQLGANIVLLEQKLKKDAFDPLLTSTQKKLFQELVIKFNNLHQVLRENPEIEPEVFKILVEHFDEEAEKTCNNPERPYTAILDSARQLNTKLYGISEDTPLQKFVTSVVCALLNALLFAAIGMLSGGIGLALGAGSGFFVGVDRDYFFQQYFQRKSQDKFWQEQSMLYEKSGTDTGKVFAAVRAFEVRNSG
jgi:hypothetical protein